jgi:hypothetical protein
MAKNRAKTDDRHLVKYLLGELGEDEANQIEEEYFVNYPLVEQLRAVEEDLIEDYVQNRLSRKDRRTFEHGYLTTVERQERVRFARGFVAVLRKTSASVTVSTAEVPREPWWKAVSAWIRVNKLVFGLAIALLILAGAVGVILESAARLSNQLAQNERERDHLQAETAALRDQGQELEQKIAAQSEESVRLNSQLAELRQDLDAMRSRLAEANRADAGVRSFLLTSVLIRGIGQPPQILPVDSEARFARLRIRLQDDEYRRFLGEIATLGGEKMWAGRLIARRGPSGVLLSIQVPLEKVLGKDAILTVNGKKGAETGKLAEYIFRVVPR